MNKRLIIGVIFILIAGTTILIWSITVGRPDKHNATFTLKSKAFEPVAIATGIPTPTPTSYEEAFKHPSPDGKVFVELTAKHTSSTSIEYTIRTMDNDGSNIIDVYRTELANSEIFTIPFNSWSPDNRYFFIEKNTGDAYVFTRDGKPVTDADTYFDVKTIFSTNDRPERYQKVTGWASPTLLIVHTVNAEGNKGFSYWFEVPSKAIIQLSGDF